MGLRSILERHRSKRSRAARKSNVVRLAVEALEDRTVLSGFGGEGISHDPNDWPMFGHDARGTRHNFAEHRLGPDNVDDIEVKWTFPTDGPLAGTPAVVNNVVYAADAAGTVYALSRDGDLLWRTTLNVPSLITAKIATGPLVTNRTVVIGDLAGQIHGLDIDDGELRWTIRPSNGPLFPDGHPFQQILAAGTMVGKYVAFGISTNESLIPLFIPDYPGFTFRGNVVLIDPSDGRLVWQTFFVDVPTLQPDGEFGPSGATVWSSPAYDHASKTIFVGTGQNFSQPTTETSDALIALDAADGSIKWIAQKMPGDDFNFGPDDFPPGPGETVDADFGDSPQLYRLNGRLVVAAGQKSGFFHVLDAETGAPVATPKQFLAHGLLGGFHIDSGYANGINYATGNDWPGAFLGLPPEGASLFAISADGTEQLWKFDVDSAILSGVAIANGVVYVQEIDGDFWAVDAETGNALKHLFTGGSASGAAVSRGQIYLGTGNVLAALFDPFAPLSPGSIVALGLPDPVQVESVVINDGSSQRSMVTSLTVTFSGEVTLEEGAFRLRRQGGGFVDVSAAASVVNGKTVAVLSFSGSDIKGGSLADGNYTLTIRADRIHDGSGQRLDGDGDGDEGGNRVDTFFRLYGDSDGDRDVDVNDLQLFLSTLGKRQGEQDFLDFFDFDGDRDVDLRDAKAFLRRLGTRLRP